MQEKFKDNQLPGAEGMGWLSGGLLMCILPHARHMPIWIMTATVALILWRLGGEFRHRPLPVRRLPSLRYVPALIAAAGFAGIFSHYHTLVGREAGTAMLVLLAGFKILETRSGRDFYVSVFLGYFIIVTNFFYTQSIATALYMLVTVTALTTALITHNDPGQSRTPVDRLRLAGGMLIQAVPVLLILFLLFPRISDPLWGLPRDAHAGHIGISNRMEPGSISQLFQSGEVAFRVEFKGPSPERTKLYWRGPVFGHDDGRGWSRVGTNIPEAAPLAASGSPLHYTVTLEPTNQHWLFALEMPEQPPAQGYISSDYQLYAREPVQERMRYELSSRIDYQLDTSSPAELQRALQLPDAHPRAIAMGRSWRETGAEPAAIVQNALRMFNQEKFYYTLTPPLITGDNVDEFLFGTRQGFCEHYSGAFVVLMRAAGIPARVVTGYQGGEFNPVGNYLIIYQRDAHAWAEVWLGKRGWVRVDPTSAVAPERVQEGIRDALPETIRGIAGVFGGESLSRNLWQNLRHNWDAANNQWNQWVISYGPQRQTLFLEQFGLGDADFRILTLILVVIVGVLLIALAFWLMRAYTPVRDPARQLYDRFCRKLARIGMRRLPSEGPLDFARRAGKRYKTLCEEIDEITRLYILSRYASQNRQLAALRQRVRKFRPVK
jgi:transglutaminase-like putative cysteine protease